MNPTIRRTLARTALSTLATLAGCYGGDGSALDHSAQSVVAPIPAGTCPTSYEAAISTFGYTGYAEDVLVTSSNYNSTQHRIDYGVTIRRNGSCFNLYTVRVPTNLGSDAFEASVRTVMAGTIGQIDWTAGSIPTVVDSGGASLTSGARGPFVVTAAMAASVGDTHVYTLLDARVLGSLPQPRKLNGALAVGLQLLVVANAHSSAILFKKTEIDTFRFRADLGDMDAASQTIAADAIKDYMDHPAEYADHYNTTVASIWQDHHHIDHPNPYTATVPDPSDGSGTGIIGGFWNGHRIYLQGCEDYLATLSSAERVPFRRLPSWDPVDPVPSAFSDGIDDATAGAAYDMTTTIPNALAANVCAGFAPADPTNYTQVTGRRTALMNYINPWHGNVHTHVGGTDEFASIDTAAHASIFWPWHTTVDVVLQNFESCGYVRTTLPLESSW